MQLRRMIQQCANRSLIIRRKLIRAYLKAIGDKRFKSTSDFWPWIEISPVEAGRYSILFRGREVCTTSPFADFRDTGGAVAIIGSGPSVNSIDIRKLAENNCILLNGAISLLKPYGIKPLATVIMDSTFVEKRFDMLKLLPDGSNLIITPGVIRAVAERDFGLLSRMRVYLTQNITNNVYTPNEDFAAQRKQAVDSLFSFNLDSGFIDCGTVMALAVQFAFQIGAEPTYMIGFDIGNSSEPRFYETGKNHLKCGLLEKYESSILPFMTSASKVFAESGRTIYNCSTTSKLPYEVIPYSDEFRF